MASSIKRIVAYHVSRLQDKNPEVRLKAVNELSHLVDQDALDALQEVFKNDTDNSVRKAAQQAGRALFVKLKEQETNK